MRTGRVRQGISHKGHRQPENPAYPQTRQKAKKIKHGRGLRKGRQPSKNRINQHRDRQRAGPSNPVAHRSEHQPADRPPNNKPHRSHAARRFQHTGIRPYWMQRLHG